MGQIPNNFTIIKSITIILIYVSMPKKNLSYFFLTLIHTNYLSQKWQHFALVFIFFSTHSYLSWLSYKSCLLSISGFLLEALFFLVRQSCSLCGNPFSILQYAAHTYSTQTIFIYNLASHHNSNTSQITSLSTISHELLFQRG